jgi:hypothetical protein
VFDLPAIICRYDYRRGRACCPEVDVTADDACHTQWVTRDRRQIDAITAAFDAISCTSPMASPPAAASPSGGARRAANRSTGENPTIISLRHFPDNQMQIWLQTAWSRI